MLGALLVIALSGSNVLLSMSQPAAVEDPKQAPLPSRSNCEFTMEEVARHNSQSDIWGVVDGYVLDLTNFVKDHPGGEKIFQITHEKRFSFAHGPNAHFGATSAAFAAACRDFESKGRPEGFEFAFQNSRKNGGLDNAGSLTGRASGPVGTVKFLGKVSTA
ncbi:CYB2 [Symbiodinium sp. CCMP2456]|nr:CYB2 [Symbiodinium sp. CCMP2456]